MSFLKDKLGRSAAVVAFTLGAFQALSIVGALPAQAVATCSVASGVVTVATDEADRNFIVYEDTNGGIHVASNASTVAMPNVGLGGNDLGGCTGVQTGVATTTTINITGASGGNAFNQTVLIQMAKVDATALNTYTTTLADWGAINWTVSMGSNTGIGDSFAVVDSGNTTSPLNLTGGANGFDLNTDGNLDVTTAGVENFYFDSASQGINTINLNGDTTTGATFASGAFIGYNSAVPNVAFNPAGGGFLWVNNPTLGGSVLTGGSGNDTIRGTDGADTVAPGLGNDFVDSHGNGFGVGDGLFGDGQDTIDYSNTTTAINVNLPGNTVSQGADIDTLVGFEDVVGTSAGDTILGRVGQNNWIQPGGGNDIVNGNGPGDMDTIDYSDATTGVTVDLTAGTSTGGSGSDTLAGIEDINGSGANDSLTGDVGGNMIWGNGGNDTLAGGPGDGDGSDQFDGGAGIDTLDYGTNTLGTSVSLGVLGVLGHSNGITGEDDHIAGATIENAILGTGDDSFTGSLFNNIVWPNGGQNALTGGGGGIDTVNYSKGYTAGVLVNLSGGGAAGGNQDSITGFTNAVGTAFNDTLIGTDVVLGTNGANLLVGAKGNDSISGNAGPDLVRAGAGNDNVRGGNGDDDLFGQGGNDFIRGGNGDDNIIGGKGKDRCIGGGGRDKVKCEKAQKSRSVSSARIARLARLG